MGNSNPNSHPKGQKKKQCHCITKLFTSYTDLWFMLFVTCTTFLYDFYI